jgi:hypothetical protein
MHGDEEGTIKPTLGEFFQADDIIRTPTDGLRCKSTWPIDVEDTSTLCVAKDIVVAENVRLRVRHIPHRITIYETYIHRPDV